MILIVRLDVTGSNIFNKSSSMNERWISYFINVQWRTKGNPILILVCMYEYQ